MDREKILELANEGRSETGLIKLRSVSFGDLPNTSRQGYRVIAQSDDIRFISVLYGCGSVLYNWVYVSLAEITQAEQEALGSPGAYVLWSSETNHRVCELLSGFVSDFTAGWRLALAPIRAAEIQKEKDAAEAAKAAYRELEEAMLSIEWPANWANYDEIEVDIPKSKLAPGFSTGKNAGYGRKKRVVVPRKYAKHLLDWIEKHPEDPANDLYRAVAERIDRSVGDL